MALLSYAGKPPQYKHRERAYMHFRLGRDTAAIAKIMKATEWTVLRWITIERCYRLGLPNPFESEE